MNYDYYPMKVFRFQVMLGGEELLCSEVSGMDASYEEIEYRNGADDKIVKHKQHGLITYSNITLKHGMTDSLKWFQFVSAQIEGVTDRHDLLINLYGDAKDTVVATWQVRDAWVLKWTGPDLNSTSSEAAFETIELCHEGIERLEVAG
jgi:phage tail-like protein